MSAVLPNLPEAAHPRGRNGERVKRMQAAGQTALRRTIAVAIHDIEPATFSRCALMRDWLADHGVDRATLLVIPARDLHPLDRRSPEMIEWLGERRRCGDAIAQHGFMHAHLGPSNTMWRLVGDDAEFRGLDERETRQAVDAGWRVLKLAGVEPSGFVAPAYAYTTALRETLAQRFDWWAGLLRLHSVRSRQQTALAPALRLSAGGPLRRVVTPRIVGAGALLAPETLRLDLRPGDLDHPRHMSFLENLLSSSGRRRTAVTYDDLAAA